MAGRIPNLLPGAWTNTVRSSVLHAVSVAAMALTRAWGAAPTSPRRATRPLAELDRAITEIVLLEEELSIKDARWSRIAPRRRPSCRPVQRMRILKLKAATWRSPRSAVRTGKKPKHIITDRGSRFDCDIFRAWCGDRSVRPRYGAVGKQGSVAAIERFLLSLKTGHTRRILVPFGFDAMRREIGLHPAWYNESRPHQGLAGMTAADQYDADESDGHARQVEPRPRSPVDEGAVRVKRLDVVVKFVEGGKHRAIVDLTRAA